MEKKQAKWQNNIIISNNNNNNNKNTVGKSWGGKRRTSE
jgi:hypothetical protein